MKTLQFCSSLTSVMVFKATFNNLLVISWRLVSLVEQIGVPGERSREETHTLPIPTHWNICILKWKTKELVIYLKNERVDPFHRHTCIYILYLYIRSDPMPVLHTGVVSFIFNIVVHNWSIYQLYSKFSVNLCQYACSWNADI
jgi:hypothetical protein